MPRVVVNLHVRFSGRVDGVRVPLKARTVFAWYCAHFRHWDLADGRILWLQRTRRGLCVQFLFNDGTDTAGLEVLASMLADPDDDGNYPIGIYIPRRALVRYDRDFTQPPSALANVLVVGHVHSLTVLRSDSQ